MRVAEPGLTGAEDFVGEAEVDQEPEASPVHHEVVPLLETLGPGSGKHRGAEEVAAREHRAHRSHRLGAEPGGASPGESACAIAD